MDVTPIPVAPAHDHKHHGHEHHQHMHHGHTHHVHATSSARAALPRFSLIALSGLQRLALALPAVVTLWILAFWAMRHG